MVECKRNNGIMVLSKALRKTMRHKDATIFHYVHCVSLSIFDVFDSHFQCGKFLPKIVKDRYLTNEYIYRADITYFTPFMVVMMDWKGNLHR